MPAFVRKTIKRKSVTITSTTPVLIATYDPRLVGEIAAADDQLDYINVETNGGATLVYRRHDGASGDLLQNLDATPQAVSATGITKVTWPTPAGAARRLDILGSVASGSEDVTLECDTVFRVQGG